MSRRRTPGLHRHPQPLHIVLWPAYVAAGLAVLLLLVVTQ